MTQASVNITQQFQNGQVVPAQLVGQNAVSKTYVDEQLALRDTNIAAATGAASAAQADIDAHEVSPTAHPAQNITYSGLVAGAGNVKQGLDNLYTRVNNIIDDGDSSAEVVDARGGYPVLGDRLNASDAQLADVETKLLLFVTVKDYGAKGDGTTDDTAAFNAALNAAMCVYVPEGVYKIDGTITLKKIGQKLIGAGFYATRLISSSSNTSLIIVPDGFSQVTISDMTLGRSVAAVSGAYGIYASGNFSYCRFERLTIENQFIGMLVGASDIGWIESIALKNNYYDGLYMTNNANYNNCQWIVTDLLLSANDRNGATIVSDSSSTGMSLGKWTNINSFGNNGSAISVVGSASSPIHGFRLSDSFIGGDGAVEIRLDTYGGMHTINDVFIEYAGQSATGRTGTTPATNTGSGIALTPNNTDCLISGCYIAMCSDNGIESNAGNITISNVVCVNNGRGTTAGFENGIAIYAGKAIITAARLQGNQIGLYGDDGAKITIGLSDLTENTTTAAQIINNPTQITSVGNKPALA